MNFLSSKTFTILLRLFVFLIFLPLLFLFVFNVGEMLGGDMKVSTLVYASKGDDVKLTYYINGVGSEVSPSSVEKDVGDKYMLSFKVPRNDDGIYSMNFAQNTGTIKITSLAFKTMFHQRTVAFEELNILFSEKANISNNFTSNGLYILEGVSEGAYIKNMQTIKPLMTSVGGLVLVSIISLILSFIFSAFITKLICKFLPIENKPVLSAAASIAGYAGGVLFVASIIITVVAGVPNFVFNESTVALETDNPLNEGEVGLTLEEQIALKKEELAEKARLEREALGIEEVKESGFDETEPQPLMIQIGGDSGEGYNSPKVALSDLSEGFTAENVHVGKTDENDDIWFFYGDEFPDFTGENLFSSAQLKRIASNLMAFNDWLESEGVKFYIAICPNKSTVYPEFVPSSIIPSETTRYSQLAEYLDFYCPELNFIDLRESQMKAKETDYPTYYLLDTHWNNYGGFAAYTQIMETIQKDFPAVRIMKRSDYKIDMYDSYMKDQPWYLGYYDFFEEMGPVFTPLKKTGTTLVRIDTGHYGGIFLHAYTQKNGFHDYNSYVKFSNEELKTAGAPSLFVIRDSFSIALINFLKDSFSESSYKWTTAFDKDAVLEESPDIVIYEIVERSLNEVMRQNFR